jgi:transposase
VLFLNKYFLVLFLLCCDCLILEGMEMTYSKDLRIRVLSFVRDGHTQAEAADRYGVSRSVVRLWLNQPADHKAGKPGPKASRKYDQELLLLEVKARPDALLRELAASRGVSIHSIFLALRRMGFRRKKNTSIR